MSDSLIEAETRTAGRNAVRALGKLVLVVVLVACERGGPETPRRGPTAPLPGPGQSAVDQPHVAFTAAALVIDRLESAIAPPVSSASRPSPQTLVSSDTSIVEVDASGMLVAHAPGSAVVRASSGDSVLEVSVVAPAAIRVAPERLELEPHGRAPVRVLDPRGSAVPQAAVRWVVLGGAPVAVVNGEVIAMGPPGVFELRAQVGAASAMLTVAVSHTGPTELTISPPKPRFHKGEVKVLQAMTPAGGVAAAWTSNDQDVLVSIGGGLFQAMRAGKSKVCATALDQIACSIVEVSP